MATSYPGGVDSFGAPAGTDSQSTPVGGRTHSQSHTDLGDAVEAIETELGVNPSGASATVVARLDALDAAWPAADAAHVAAGDPHPQYETSAEAAAKVTAHAGASDPHGDRAYAAGLVDDLSGVTNAATARTNLGLGDAATKNVGTAAGTVAAGDDPRITGSASTEAWVDWTTKADGTPTVLDSGHVVQLDKNSNVGSAYQIISGALTNAATTGSGSAGAYSYLTVELGAACKRIGGEFTIAAGAAGSVVLVIWRQRPGWAGIFPSNVVDSPCHLIVSRTGWSYGFFEGATPGGGGTLTNVASGTFSTPLTAGATYRVEVYHVGSTAWILLPDGSWTTLTDSRIESLEGAFPCWEVAQSDATDTGKPAWLNGWVGTRTDYADPINSLRQVATAHDELAATLADYEPLAGAFRLPWRSGFWYASGIGARTTGAPPQSDLLFTPIWVPAGITVDRIGCEVTATAAGSSVRLGIYSSRANGLPGALLVDAGTVNTASSTGSKELVLGTPLALTGGGLFWLAAVSQGGVPTLRSNGTTLIPGFPSTSALGSLGPNTYSQSGVTGALPANAATEPTVTTSGTTVWIRTV